MDYRKRKTTKCTNPDCICFYCKNKKNTSLTKCPNGNCRYCEREYPNDTRECANFCDYRKEDKMPSTKTNCSQDGLFENTIEPYTMVYNAALHDDTLSFKAKGLYAVIRSFITIPNFQLYKSYLMQNATDGIRSFNSGWEELKEHGYLKQKRIRVEKGFIYKYALLNEPDLSTPSTINIKMDGTVAEPEENNRTTSDNIKNNEHKKTSLDIEVNDEDFETLTSSEIEKTTQKIKKQINYENFKSEDPKNNAQIDNLLNLMVEIAITKKPYVKAGNEKFPTADIQAQYKKIDKYCIADILKNLKQYSKPIKNPRAFLIAVLYNAPKTAATRLRNNNKLSEPDLEKINQKYIE